MSDDLHSLHNVISYHVHKLKKITRTQISHEELESIAMGGYMQCKKNYNPKFGRLSLSYASWYIETALYKAINAQVKYNSKHVQIDNLENNENSVLAPEVNLTTLPIFKTMEKYVKMLPSKYRHIIYSTYLAEKPLRLIDLAEEYGLSKQRIHQLKDIGLQMLKDLITRDNVELSEEELKVLRGETV